MNTHLLYTHGPCSSHAGGLKVPELPLQDTEASSM